MKNNKVCDIYDKYLVFYDGFNQSMIRIIRWEEIRFWQYVDSDQPILRICISSYCENCKKEVIDFSIIRLGPAVRALRKYCSEKEKNNTKDYIKRFDIKRIIKRLVQGKINENK